MKNLKITVVGLIFLLLCASPGSAAVISLFDWAFNVDKTVYVASDFLPAGLNASGFDWDTGLGTLEWTISGPGAHSVLAFFDHEIDEKINSFYNEYGATSGSPAAGQSWEIDEPGYVFGDIYSNFENGTLDNSNGVPINAPDDVSLAIGWEFSLADDEEAVIEMVLSTTMPGSGFFLAQYDPYPTNGIAYFAANNHAATAIYFHSSLITGTPGEQPIPEPSTVLLLGAGLIGVCVAGRKRLLRK